MSHNCNVHQSGIAVILTLLTLLLGAGSALLLRSVTDQTSTAEATGNLARTGRLMQARQALLSYATAYADNYLPSGAGPGHLPCPDRSPIRDGYDGNDGPDPPCRRDRSNTGRFPRFTYSRDQPGSPVGQKRIEFYPERSLMDQQMWYVVSRSHINNPVNTVVNPSTRGQLQVDSDRDVAAVIIEPGKDLATGRLQRPGDSIEAYLEGENADFDVRFSQRANTAGNDLLVYITAAELMAVTRSRVTLFVIDWLKEFYGRHCGSPQVPCYPAAGNERGDCEAGREAGFLPLYQGSCEDSLTPQARLDGVEPGRHWFVRNDWLQYFRYRRDPRCINQQSVACELQVEEDTDLQIPVLITVVPLRVGLAERVAKRVST